MSLNLNRLPLLVTILLVSFASCETSKKNPEPSTLNPDLKAIWSDLGGIDPARSYEAMGKLVSTAGAVQYLAERLKPVKPNPADIKRFLADLDADAFIVRENASVEIEKVGETVEPELRAALKIIHSPEGRDRIQKLLNSIKIAHGIPMPSGEPLRRLLAIQVLEMLGTSEARAALESIATNSNFKREREAAGKAMGRIRVSAAASKPPVPTTSLPISVTNSAGMRFQYIPWGSFLMGSPENEEGRRDGETQHPVQISTGFYLGTTEVTQKQWKAVMGNNPSEFKGDELPVANVTWNDAVEFCKKLSEKEGRCYRLPTEAEWEYACRAGTTTPFNTGWTIRTDQANYDGENTYGNGPKGVYRGKPTPVGSFPPNNWGLYDMHGNVAEWCQDWLDDSYSSGGGLAVDPHGPLEGRFRILRGGLFRFRPQDCRSAFRGINEPYLCDYDIGFRIVLDQYRISP